MTRIIKASAIIAPVLLLAGTLFKTNHWPGANVILVVGAAAGILFMILLAGSSSGHIARGFAKFNSIFAVLAIIAGLTAFVFKVLHWQGAGILVWIADTGIILACIFYLADGLLEKDPVKRSLKFITTFFILLLVLIILLMG
jgi:hypothetical protein